jgi:hypothetical protein
MTQTIKHLALPPGAPQRAPHYRPPRPGSSARWGTPEVPALLSRWGRMSFGRRYRGPLVNDDSAALIARFRSKRWARASRSGVEVTDGLCG